MREPITRRARFAAAVGVAAVGLVLALAVHPARPGTVDVNAVGWILFAIGLAGVALDLVRLYLRSARRTRSPAT